MSSEGPKKTPGTPKEKKGNPNGLEEQILSEIRVLDREIARTRTLIRVVPAEVLMPLAEDALTRIRRAAAQQALPAAALPPVLATAPIGSIVRTPPRSSPKRGIVIGIGVPVDGRETRLLLLETGEVVTVPADELTPEQLSQAPAPAETSTPKTTSPSSSNPGTSDTKPPGETAEKGSNPHAATPFKPGDRVVYRDQAAVVTRVLDETPPMYEVRLDSGETFFAGAAELRLV